MRTCGTVGVRIAMVAGLLAPVAVAPPPRHPGAEAAVSLTDSNPETEVAAAHLAVKALHTAASTTQRLEEVGWLLLPEGRSVTSDQLVDYLRMQAKPIKCLASRVGARIGVTCSSGSSDGDPHAPRATKWALESLATAIASSQRAHRESLEDSVLVRSGDLSEIVPLVVVESFLADYVIWNVTLGFSGTDSDARARGARIRVHIGVAPSDGAVTETEPEH